MELKITDKSQYVRILSLPMMWLEGWTEKEIAEELVAIAKGYEKPVVLHVYGYDMTARKGETVEQVLERLERDKIK